VDESGLGGFLERERCERCATLLPVVLALEPEPGAISIIQHEQAERRFIEVPEGPPEVESRVLLLELQRQPPQRVFGEVILHASTGRKVAAIDGPDVPNGHPVIAFDVQKEHFALQDPGSRHARVGRISFRDLL
jgi:hypothetical protein